MANTYPSLHFHIIFSTKSRQRWITEDLERLVRRPEIRRAGNREVVITVNRIDGDVVVLGGEQVEDVVDAPVRGFVVGFVSYVHPPAFYRHRGVFGVHRFSVQWLWR